MPRPALLALPVLSLAACAPVGQDEEFVTRAPAASVVGEAVSCIDTQRVRSQTVHDDRTIDFRVGRQVYRNTLRSPCPGLRVRDAITYDTYNSRLCTPEIVYTLETFGGELRRGAPCSLGEFVPIEYVDRDVDTMGE